MKAINVYVDEESTDKVGAVVEKLNGFDEIVATMVGAKEIFVAACGECTMLYAICILETEFKSELSIKYVK